MKTLLFHIGSPADLARLGVLLGEMVQPGQVITLDGDLGAGKTTLTQAIAKGLHIPDNCYVTSPSFAIMHEYLGGRLVLYHMDFYRLQDSAEVYDLGFEEYIYSDGCTVIEWSQRAEEVIPAKSLRIDFTITDENSRELTVQIPDEDSPLYWSLQRLSFQMKQL